MIHTGNDGISRSIDLNCDFGEGYGAYTFGQDETLLNYVTSVNIACGFHAGDPHTIREAVSRAVQAGVAVGAHPGLPDRLGFGRREIALSPSEVYEITLYQIGALDAFVRASGSKLKHVKPHGALYHMAGGQASIAEAFVQAVRAYDSQLKIYGQSGSLLLAEAQKQGLSKVSEVFADRAYIRGGQLAPRRSPGAVLSSPEAALQQTLYMLKHNKVRTLEGEEAAITAETVCLHGDGEHAGQFAAALRNGLAGAGIVLQPPS
ncbi:LamB/YcsF family protein [Paenibacillus solisilvae]|uniref:5-oxoprolinase subunit A n=1 Tax=Paenibacillus solisilvae TaxID=2486751 RepID=A0ABW0VU13_9BACL